MEKTQCNTHYKNVRYKEKHTIDLYSNDLTLSVYVLLAYFASESLLV